eukprot:485530-Rhodomonas_salina.1
MQEFTQLAKAGAAESRSTTVLTCAALVTVLFATRASWGPHSPRPAPHGSRRSPAPAASCAAGS